MDIYPSILTDSMGTLNEQLEMAKSLPEIHTVQIDVIDGEYTDNLTLSPIDLIGTQFDHLTVDFHLMVNEPVDYVYECKQIDAVRSVIGQVERMNSQTEFITEALELNIQPGLSLDLYTPVEEIDEESWEKLRIIQIMGNMAGIQGQTFKAEVALKKIREVAAIQKRMELSQLEILVDIGVNEDTIGMIADAGATGVAPGSALWKSNDIEATLERMMRRSEK